MTPNLLGAEPISYFCIRIALGGGIVLRQLEEEVFYDTGITFFLNSKKYGTFMGILFADIAILLLHACDLPMA